MAEQPADGNLGFSCLGELRPVLGNPRIEIESTLLDEAVCTERGHALGRRVDVHQCFALPLAAVLFGRVGVVAAPEIDDRITVQREGDRRTDLAPILHPPREDLTHSRKSRITISVDGDCQVCSPDSRAVCRFQDREDTLRLHAKWHGGSYSARGRRARSRPSRRPRRRPRADRVRRDRMDGRRLQRSVARSIRSARSHHACGRTTPGHPAAHSGKHD